MTPEEIKMLLVGIIIGIAAGQAFLFMMIAFLSANKKEKSNAIKEE